MIGAVGFAQHVEGVLRQRASLIPQAAVEGGLPAARLPFRHDHFEAERFQHRHHGQSRFWPQGFDHARDKELNLVGHSCTLTSNA